MTVAAMGGDQFPQDDGQDADLQKAIAMSKQQMPEQETGIVPAGQQFGPATRTDYDPRQWAMTAVASARELVEHPPPSRRRRLPGQPAFLRGSSETGYLAPLLNIYHSIPLARRTFLSPSLRVHNYGNDSSWWSGSSDENAKSLSLDISNHSSPERQNFLAELQCLMAFLDSTERAYGSVDALSELHFYKHFNAELPASRLLEVWRFASLQQDPGDPGSQIFSSLAVKNFETTGSHLEKKEFLCLEAPLEDSHTRTLIDLLDMIVWHDSVDDVDDVWMEYCAEVFTMRLSGPRRDGTGLGLEIPPIWYPERYMSNLKDAARDMRKQVAQLRKDLRKAESIQRRCENARSADNRVIKIRETLEAASRIAVGLASKELNHRSTSPGAGPNESGQVTLSELDVQAEVHNILQQLDKKVKALEEQKRTFHNEIRQISRQFAQSNQESNGAPQRQYVLQGVSTRPNITYVRIRDENEPDLIEFGDLSRRVAVWQWWRFEWQGASSKTHQNWGPRTQAEAMAMDSSHQHDSLTSDYSIQKVSEVDVLEAARTENDVIMLVYADQRAIDMDPGSVSLALKKFVQQDNRTFEGEIDQGLGISTRRYSEDTNTTIMDENAAEENDTSMPSPEPERELVDGNSSDAVELQKSGPSTRGYDARLTHGYLDAETSVYTGSTQSETHEMRGNKIGMHAEALLDKYGSGDRSEERADGPIHIEHARTPLR